MVERILALGASGLPNPIKCISWKEVEDGFKKGQKINISDYNIVFIDFSYFIEHKGDEGIILVCLNQNKFFEVIKSGIDLFILGIPDYFSMPPQREFIQFYSWFPDIVRIFTTSERGEIIKCLNESFLGYYGLLKNYFFYFVVKQSISERYPYLYDVKELAINNGGKKLGFVITNFRKIDIKLFSASSAAEAFGLRMNNYVVETYKGKLYLLHTLEENSGDGILSILKNMYNFSFSRQKPEWCDEIQIKKSSIIGNEIRKLFEDKQKIESLIVQKQNDVEGIEFYKQLLWQVGEELEKVVHESLKLIGLLPSPPTKADDDGIFNYYNEEYMLEIKSGLERGATFGELSKLITRIENRKKLNRKDCKGIFVMNHFANFPLKDRDEPFPKNVIDTAKVNNVKLITTEQLFNIIKPILNEELSVADAQKQLFSL